MGATCASRCGVRSQTAETRPAAATKAPPPAMRQPRATRTRRSRARSRSAATATRTLAFCAGSTSGIGRSAAAMRMMVSSVSSCTEILREPKPQRVAGALHPHLQRGDSRAGGDRHVVVRQVFHVSHQERLALLGRQRRQRTRDLLAPGDRLVVTALARALRDLAELDELGTTSLARAGAAAAIREDAEQPWLERLPLLVAGQRTVHPNERILHGLLGIAAIGEHVHREAQ